MKKYQPFLKNKTNQTIVCDTKSVTQPPVVAELEAPLGVSVTPPSAAPTDAKRLVPPSLRNEKDDPTKQKSLKSVLKKTPHPALKLLKEQYDGETTQGLVFTCTLNIENLQDFPQTAACGGEKNGGFIKAIAKISHNVDFVMELEREAWRRLSVFESPHFCELLKIVPINNKSPQHCLFYKEITTHVDGGVDLAGAPAVDGGRGGPEILDALTSSPESHTLSSSSSRTAEGEPRHHRETLNDALYSDQKHPAAILNCIRQVFCAIMQYQSVGITHYDLHTDNIMIANTPYDLHVYEIDSDFVSIPTFGIAPVIIDFGLAYIENFNWAATNNFLHLGLTTFMRDSTIDCIFLLSNIVQSINIPNHWLTSQLYPEINKVVEFVKKTQMYLSKLPLDENGWFLTSDFIDINEEILKDFPLSIEGIFSPDYIYNTLSMLQFLTIVPFTDRGKAPVGGREAANNALGGSTNTKQNLKKMVKLFKKQLLETKTLWIETVESKIHRTNEQAVFFKQIILNLADSESKPAHYLLKKLKTRYPMILNLKRLRDNIKTLNVSYCNIVHMHLKHLINVKTKIYSSLPFKNLKDFIRTMPCIEYKVSPGMNVLVQKIWSSDISNPSCLPSSVERPMVKPYAFQLTKDMAVRINRDPSYLKRLIQTRRTHQI